MAMPPGTGWRDRLLWWAEQALAHLLLPLLLLALLKRAWREPAHLRHLDQRFGLGTTGSRGAVWIYAASVGETRAVSPLVRDLRAAGHTVLLTHQSPAGLAEGHRLFPDDPGITHRHVPVDLWWALRLFLRRARPVALLVCEIEIWPAMLRESRRAGLPCIMVNGNLLPKAMPDGSRLRDWLLGHYRLFTHVFTRTEEYRDRYLALGLPPAAVTVVGEMKYDQWIDATHPATGARLRGNWPATAPVLLIASSVQAEEDLLVPMVAGLLQAPGLEDLRVIWAPRSPQRFDALSEKLMQAGIAPLRRSGLGDLASAGLPPETRVLLGDSIGEMNIWYPMADLVFVGASLNDWGGHNIMEPMAFGKPVVMGPSIYGIAFAAEPAGRAGAFESLPDVDALAARIAGLLHDRPALARMSQAAAGFAASQTGAAGRTLAGLRGLLPPPRG